MFKDCCIKSLKIACITVSLGAVLAANTMAEVKSPAELFAERESRVDDIPDNWGVTNPIRFNICFNLVHEVNSPEANAFLRTMYSTLDSFDYDVDIAIYRSMYPADYEYCIDLEFVNWNEALTYETSDEFLTFYRSEWKPAVAKSTEHWAVRDLNYGKK